MAHTKAAMGGSDRPAIDILPVEFHYLIMEKDHWWGPKLSWSDVDDPNRVGLTAYGLPKNDEDVFSRVYPLDRTEFLWTYRNGLKTLQVEEVRAEPVNENETRGERI